MKINIKEKLHEKFNVEAISKEPASEGTQFMLYANGFVEGMLTAAAILDDTWFKTQQGCAEAIRQAARKL